MYLKKITLGILLVLVIVACAPQPVNTSQVTAPTQEVITDTVPATDGQSSLPETQPLPVQEGPSVVGSFFSGQGPSTFPIVKELGPVLLHFKVENCNPSVILSKKGQNIPYMSNKVVSTDQFDDQFQFFNEFQGEPNREETIILDNPTPYDDFGGASPQTEELRVQEVSADCRWEITLLPISTARTLSPGETITGSYADVFIPANNLSGTKLLFMSPGHEMMLQHFNGIFAVFADGHAVDLMPMDSDYFEFSVIPDGTIYIEVFAKDYWEIQGN